MNMKSSEDITGIALLLEGIGFSHKLEKRRILVTRNAEFETF